MKISILTDAAWWNKSQCSWRCNGGWCYVSRLWENDEVGLGAIFFFQAEDGIRDYKVTGVQTCALPIFHAFAEETSATALLDLIKSKSASRTSPPDGERGAIRVLRTQAQRRLLNLPGRARDRKSVV